VRFAATAAQAISSSGGDPRVAAAIDPVAGGGDDCATTASADAPGTAVYRLPAATGAGYTLLGAPAVTAKLSITGDAAAAQIASRLWDVAPGGGPQTLVARGTYRPSGKGTETWQLHANGWRFAAGHVPKLELLGSDAPYTRVSNGSFDVAVQSLELRLPIRGEAKPKAKAKHHKRRARKRKAGPHRKRASRRAQPRFTG
jgi:hypothetical protein